GSGDAGAGEFLVEGVARTAHGADRIAAAAESLAEPPDMDVDRALVDINVAAPDAVQHLGTGEDAAGRLHEELEELELGRPEMELATGAADAVGLAIELEVAGL